MTARRLQFVTGADVTGGLPADQNWAALADDHATTVVFMGQRTFPAMAASLIEQSHAATHDWLRRAHSAVGQASLLEPDRKSVV